MPKKQDKYLKERKHGKKPCRRCGCYRGVIQKYGMNLCRRCFKEMAELIGFKKYD